MVRARSRSEMERAATICVAIHNAHCSEDSQLKQLEDLCPWLPRRRPQADERMTMGELGELIGQKFPGQR